MRIGNLLILSEGLVSNGVNMVLTGLALSVYRYDTVIGREEAGADSGPEAVRYLR